MISANQLRDGIQPKLNEHLPGLDHLGKIEGELTWLNNRTVPAATDLVISAFERVMEKREPVHVHLHVDGREIADVVLERAAEMGAFA